MVKRDPIFWWATGIFFTSLLLALFVDSNFAFAIVAAYLLRPALLSLGLAVKHADEREKQIHFHSGNIAFIVVIVAVAILAAKAQINHKPTGELLTLLALGLAAKALVGLVMVRDYRSAGVQITITIILVVTAFITIGSGLSAATLFGIGFALLLSFIAMLGLKYPRVIAVLLIIVAIAIISIMPGLVTILLLPLPLVVAAVCLLLSTNKEFIADAPQTTSIRPFIKGNIEKFAVFVVLGALGLVLVGQISNKEMERNKATATDPESIIEIQGVSCREGLRYYENGKLESCILAREDTLFGQTLPLGTRVFYTKEGFLRSCFLPVNTKIEGILCRGRGHDWSTGFHDNGRLETAWLAEDQEIQGIVCKKATFWTEVFGGSAMTTFYDNGQLKRCLLAKDVTVDGHSFEEGDHIDFYQNGKLAVKNEK
jgi:hypothetical protein